MANKNDNLVIGYYTNNAAAEAAAEDLKNWDKANKDVKLGAIGIIDLDKNGKLDVKEIGQRDTKKGALWGTAIGAGLGILTGGIALIPGMIIGAAVGGGAGALNHKSLGMSDADHAKLVDHLKSGGSALGIMADDFEVAATKGQMASHGGSVDSYNVPEKTAAAVTAAAVVQSDAADAVDEAVAEEVVVETDGTTAAVAAIAAATGLSAAAATSIYDSGTVKASALLSEAATPEGRAELASETGVDEADILVAAKRMDLMRVKGVGVKYSALLLASGIDTVPELGTRNAANLTAKMAEVNAADVIVDELPTEKVTASWVAQAKDLPRVIQY